MCKYDNLILGRDLNFTLSRSYIWVENAPIDNFSIFLINRTKEGNMVEIEPIKLKPTWSNNRGGIRGIPKHIDRFVMHESLLL